MVKVFKDKENTESALQRASANAEAFKKFFPAQVAALREEVSRIQMLSDTAHTSDMHYATFIKASLLDLWSQVYKGISAKNELLLKNEFSEEELIEHYPDMKDECSMVLTSFANPPIEGTDWSVYKEKFDWFQKIEAKVNSAIYSVNKKRHEKFLSCLDHMAVDGVVTNQQHDAFQWLLEHYDYYSDYSDQASTRAAGDRQRERILAITRVNKHFGKMYHILIDHYSKKLPIEVAREQWAVLRLETSAG